MRQVVALAAAIAVAVVVTVRMEALLVVAVLVVAWVVTLLQRHRLCYLTVKYVLWKRRRGRIYDESDKSIEDYIHSHNIVK